MRKTGTYSLLGALCALIDGYVESGYCGALDVSVLPQDKIETYSKIDVAMCWKGWLDFAL
jgi:hypothetical protein